MSNGDSALWTKRFWIGTADRAIKSFAQAAILFWGAGDLFDVWTVDWQTTLGMALGGAILSAATSIASAGIADRGTTSALRGGD